MISVNLIQTRILKKTLSTVRSGERVDKLITQPLVLDYVSKGIRINYVNPRNLKISILNFVPPEERDIIFNLYTVGRLGESHEVTNIVILISGGVSSINETLPLIHGGYIAQ